MIAGVADTHAALWHLFDDKRLSASAAHFIDQAAAQRQRIDPKGPPPLHRKKLGLEEEVEGIHLQTVLQLQYLRDGIAPTANLNKKL